MAPCMPREAKATSSFGKLSQSDHIHSLKIRPDTEEFEENFEFHRDVKQQRTVQARKNSMLCMISCTWRVAFLALDAIASSTFLPDC